MANEIVPAGPITPPSAAEPSQGDQIAPNGPITIPGQRPPVAPASWGDTLTDWGKVGASHLATGAADLVGLPGTLGDLFDTGVTKGLKAVGIMPQNWEGPAPSPFSGNALKQDLSSVTGGATDYEAKTPSGKWVGRVAEFVPGAIATGGGSVVKKVLLDAAVPAVVSGWAGDYADTTKKPWLKPWAELAGAILGGGIANKAERFGKTVLSPSGGADPLRLIEAQTMRDTGYPVTAGQATNNPLVQKIEANNSALQVQAGKTANSEQIQAFTKGALENYGLNDAVVNKLRANGYAGNPYVAKPQVLQALKDENSAKFNTALSGINSTGDRALLQDLLQAGTKVSPNFKMSNLPSPLQFAIMEVRDSIRLGKPIPAARLQQLRSELGEYAGREANTGVRSAAIAARPALDAAIDRAMNAVSKPDMMKLLKEARQEYSNGMIIRDALDTKGKGLEGYLEPDQLNRSAAQHDAAAWENGTSELGNYSRDAARFGEDLPQGSPNMQRRGLAEIAGGIGIANLNLTQLAAFLNLSPQVATGMAMVAGLGAGLDGVRKLAMNYISKNANKPGFQEYLMNQKFNPSAVQAPARNVLGTLPGGTQDMGQPSPTPYKRGGAVRSHDMEADQLVRAAERAKKGWNAETEPLLNQSDDAVAHALEVANRSI